MVNKTILLSVTVIVMLALSAAGVWADEGTDMTISGSDVKWSQPPDMKYGVNIQSTEEEPIVADDWKCEDPRPVTDIHFWGAHIGWETKNEKPQLRPPRVEGFVVRIYEDVPAVVGTRHYSHPGELIYEEKVGEFEETCVAAILLPDETYEHKFYYSLDLPEPFKQTEGTIYWISIAAILPGKYECPWGWETSTHHWNDDACRHWVYNNYWEEILPAKLPSGYQEQYETVDMAFELTVGSESPQIKWQQRPDMVQGTNVISIVDGYGDDDPKSLTVADDWLCLDGSPVTDLHFWGSYPGWYPYKVPRDPDTPPGIKEFRIRIYSDVPVVIGRDGFSRPGKLLYESWAGDFTETYVDSILLPWEQYEHKYRYDLDLPKSFPQEQDTIYWLSIAAVTLNHTYPWGWESSMDRWNDFAVQGWYRDPDNSKWDLIHHPQTERHIDMAFELTTGDGPIKWLQFPDMANGVNILSLPEDPVVADDWLCTDGKPITEVHFWGSYLSREEDKHWEQENPGPPKKPLSQPPGVSEFKFSFHKDIPAETDREMPWSHPGELLHEVWIDPDEVKEHYWDSIPHTGVDGNIWWEHKFYYVARLKEPFEQEKGTIYWLDIGAKPRDDSMWYWGWETSIRHWNDNAVRGWKGGNWWECLGAATIDFEDLTPGTGYKVGDAFTTSSIPVTVKQFQGSNGGWTSDGYTQIENSGQAGGSGNEMVVNNVNLDFDFGTPIKRLSLLFGEYGGNINIKINEDLRNFDKFADINGLVIGGVHVTVVDNGGNTGILILTGTIEQLAIGGQEFWIDNVKLAKRVDMAFALTTETEAAEHDLGDAPDSTNSFSASMTAYPGVSANFPTVYQAGSPPHGPIHRQPKALAFIGQNVSLESEADIGPDEDGVNNVKPLNDAANLDGADDGVSLPLVLVHCKPNTFDYVVTVVDPLYRSVNVNVWFDWNRDGDWDDAMKCSTGETVPEWAVQNQQLQLNGSGIFTFTTPRFMAWLPPQVEVKPEATWMRITLSEQKWDLTEDVFGAGGAGPADGYQYGETEDYYVKYSQPQPNTKWVQLPDLTQNGIDIKVDELRNIADDFECRSPSLLTDVHFWGSWKHDRKGKIENIRLSIHSDDPAGRGGTDSDNKFSKPDKQLWSHDFGPDEFEEMLYHTVPDPGEWWWDPASREGAIPGGDTQVWRYDIKIESDEAFLQKGTPEKPVIYWLYIVVETDEECEFGWKTREWPDQFMDDAVWDYGSELPRLWEELRYPTGHPYYVMARDISIDMAFMLTFREIETLDWGDAPDPHYPTLRGSNGASHIIDPEVHLGRWVEADKDGQPSVGAIGDDINDGTDDEDGVAIPPLRVGATTRIKVSASVSGYLNAWFDWNADGDWNDNGEYVIAEQPIPSGSSAHNIRVPGGAEPGSSYARFRFSTRPLKAVLPEPQYEGRAPDGEVEDYRFYVQPSGPDHFEPNDNFTTAFDLGSLNQNRTGLGIHEPGEEDWFKWTALNNGPVNFSVTGNVTLELYDSGGNKLAGPDKCVQWDVVADRSYRARIRAADSGMTIFDYGWAVELCGDSDNYALLFSGGFTPSYNYNRYYNNIKEMYGTLVDDYDLDPDKIWILYADGTDPAADQPYGVNSDMSYITNGTAVISGTRANLESVLTTTLPGLVDSNDHFLLYAFDHGGGADNAPATTGEEVLTGWSASTSDNDLKDWLNQVGAGHTTIVHTQCFAGGMLDNLLPVTTSTFGCAATNHYEGSYGDGFAGAFAGALKAGYGNAYEAYVYAHDHDPYAILRGTYPDNGGTWIYGKEHPWAASTANFPIFAKDTDLMLKFVDDDIMYQYPKFYIGPYPPCDPLRITHDMLLAKGMFMNDAPGMGFRIEAVNSGSLTKNGKPVVPGKTTIRYGESVIWTPPARTNSAEESEESEGIIDAFSIRAADGATVSDNSVTITIATDPAGELNAANDTVEIDEDQRDVIIDVLANDSGNGTIVVAGIGQPQRGSASLVEGQVIYTPQPNFHGSDQFTYSVTDSTLNTDTATVTVKVRSVNDPPEAYDDRLIVVMDSVNNTIDVLVNDYDVDPDPLTALPDSSPENGSITMNADNTFSYTPDAGYTGSDSFTYLADDGTDQSMATVIITVTEDADSDWSDAPEFSGSMGGGYPTRAASNGASHTIGGPWLGETVPDGEADGQPHSAALGDDNNNIDDEDGVSIPELQHGETATIEIVVGGGGGHIDAWIDWNGNHRWEHPQEQIHTGHLSDGTHAIPVMVPDASITGQTFARFRISSDGGLTPVGNAPDGEVEDHVVWIQAPQGYCECGDLNCDGEVTTADAMIALEIAAGIRPSNPAADVSGDGRVTSLDALMILQAAAGAIEIC